MRNKMHGQQYSFVILCYKAAIIQSTWIRPFDFQIVFFDLAHFLVNFLNIRAELQ